SRLTLRKEWTVGSKRRQNIVENRTGGRSVPITVNSSVRAAIVSAHALCLFPDRRLLRCRDGGVVPAAQDPCRRGAGSALKGGVEVCQRQLVNECSGLLLRSSLSIWAATQRTQTS